MPKYRNRNWHGACMRRHRAVCEVYNTIAELRRPGGTRQGLGRSGVLAEVRPAQWCSNSRHTGVRTLCRWPDLLYIVRRLFLAVHCILRKNCSWKKPRTHRRPLAHKSKRLAVILEIRTSQSGLGMGSLSLQDLHVWRALIVFFNILLAVAFSGAGST